MKVSYNEGVKRWKWWFISLGLVLTAACVLTWKLDERPPYSFMAQSALYFVETAKSPWGEYAILSFTSARSPSQLKANAIPELGKPTEDTPERLEFTDIVVIPAEEWESMWITDGAYPSIPPGTQSVIRYYRKATYLDRVRSGFSSGTFPGGTEF